MEMKPVSCPFCHSDNILPFEDEKAYKNQYKSIMFIIIAGLVLIFGYIFFVLVSYLTFPLVLISGLFLASKVLNKRETNENKAANPQQYYICLDCDRQFTLANEPTTEPVAPGQ